jgi:hypothetical protein
MTHLRLLKQGVWDKFEQGLGHRRLMGFLDANWVLAALAAAAIAQTTWTNRRNSQLSKTAQRAVDAAESSAKSTALLADQLKAQTELVRLAHAKADGQVALQMVRELAQDLSDGPTKSMALVKLNEASALLAIGSFQELDKRLGEIVILMQAYNNPAPLE